MSPWVSIGPVTPEEEAEFTNAPWNKYLADENVEPVIVNALRQQKLNVKTVDALGLSGKSDDAVYAEAWRQRRLLLSYDDDFYNDDKRFPFQACAGLIVLPPNAGQSVRMVSAVGELVPVFSRGRELWWHTKIRLKQNQATVRTWERDEGKIEVSRYRIPKHGLLQYWRDN